MYRVLFHAVYLMMVVYVCGQEILECSNKSCQKQSDLKKEIEDLFRYQQASINAQKKTTEENKQLIHSVINLQTLISEDIGVIKSQCTKQDETNELVQRLFDKLGEIEHGILLQKEVTTNLSLFLKDQAESNRIYCENLIQYQTNLTLKHQELMIQKMESLEFNISKQLEQLEKMNNTDITNRKVQPICKGKTDYVYKPEFNLCYKIYSTPKYTTPESILNKCATDDNAELIKITSADVQTYFAHELDKLQERFQYVLIQGNDKDNEGTWVFDDGTPMTYFKWNSGQPDYTTSQFYLLMNPRSSYKWHDVAPDFQERYIYVCQIDVQ